MPDKSNQGSRRASNAKADKRMKRVSAVKRESPRSKSAAKKRPSPTNNRSPVRRLTWISRAVRNVGWASFFSGAAVAVVVIISAFVLVEADRRPLEIDPALQIRLEAIEMDVAETKAEENKIRDVEGRISDLARDVSAFRSSLAGLEQRIEAEVNENGAESSVANWEERLAALKKEIQDLRDGFDISAVGGADGRFPFNGGLLLVVGQLRSAIARGTPYADEWDLAKAYAKSSPSVLDTLQRLKARRNVGVPTLTQLEKDFPLVARLLIRAEAAKVSSGWWDQTVLKLSEVVSIRPIGPSVSGNDARAVTARAEAKLASGNLEDAVSMLAEIDTQTGQAAGWLEAAGAYLEAESCLDELTQLAIVSLDVHRKVPAPYRASP